MVEGFNPDSLRLSKGQILDLISMVQRRWRKNRISNAHYLIGLTTFKAGIHITPNKTLEKIWYDLVTMTNAMISYNEMQRLKGENPKTADMIKIFEKKIESGELLGA